MTNSSNRGSKTANSQVGTPTLSILLPQLSICTFVRSSGLIQDLRQFLSSDRYILTNFSSATELLHFVEQEKHQLDCLILQEERELLPLVNQWYEQGTLLPVVIIPAESEPESATPSSEGDRQTTTYLFHPAEVRLPKVSANML